MLNGFLLFLVSIAIGCVVFATTKAQSQQLAKMQTQLQEAKEREFQAVLEKEARASEYKALRFDPAYLEVKARDRLDYAAEGERVLRFHSNP